MNCSEGELSRVVPVYRYRAYGLVIASALPLPELIGIDDETSASDITISLGRLPSEHPTAARRIGPFLWATRDEFWFAVPKIARFHIIRGRELIVDPDPADDVDGVRTFLLGTALGVALAQRGHLVMHGSAIRVGDGCVVCIGPSGAGKSTLAAGFARRGFTVLTDDLVMVDDHVGVMPGIPRIKLWADMTRAMGIDTSPLRRIRPNLEKYSYPVLEDGAGEAVPIRAVYSLVTTNADTISIARLTGFAKFEEVRRNTYRPQFIEVMEMQERYLALCARMASSSPVAQVARPMLGFTLDALVDALLTDIGVAD